MRIIVAICGVLVGLALFTQGIASAQDTAVNGLVTVESDLSVDEATTQLRTALESQGLVVVTTIDHAANAQSVGEDLRPTQLIVFGNPNLGTPLMQSSQSTAIDLPQKFLIWQGEDGQTRVAYNDPQYLVQRHGITGQDEVIAKITTALGNFSSLVATGAGQQATTAPTEAASEAATAAATTATLTETTTTEPVTATAELATPTVVPSALPDTSGPTGGQNWLLVLGALLVLVGGAVAWRVSRIGAALLVVLALLAGPLLVSTATAQSVAGLVSVESPYSVEETVSRLQSTLDEQELTTVATIDHAANAQFVGLELRPTQLIIFGNPNVGTQLMQSSQTIAIDLPQKFLVWEDEAGQVRVAYNDPQYLVQRHNITDRDDVVAQIKTALENLVNSATAQ